MPISTKIFCAAIFILPLFITTARADDDCDKFAHHIVEITAIQILEFEQQEMMTAYRSENHGAGIVMIEHGIRWLENLKNQNLEVLDKNIITKDITIYQVRLAKLHKKIGNNEQYKALVATAVSTYQSSGKEINAGKLISLVDAMDNSGK